MEKELRTPGKHVAGTKQVLRAIKNDQAAKVFLCKDADEFIYRQVQSLCEEQKVPLQLVDSMQELGRLCLVGVKTATAAVLK